MNHLIVVGFDHFDDAKAAMSDLRALERDGRISFEDTAVVQRDPDGTAQVKNELSGTTEKGAVIGAVIGGFLTFVFPIAGAVVGAAAGAAIGASMDTGVSPDFVNEVKEKIRPGSSALFLVVRQQQADPVLAALRQYRGSVIQTTLTSAQEEGLRNALARGG
jgi:uncharacterized membrane protein